MTLRPRFIFCGPTESLSREKAMSTVDLKSRHLCPNLCGYALVSWGDDGRSWELQAGGLMLERGSPKTGKRCGNQNLCTEAKRKPWGGDL